MVTCFQINQTLSRRTQQHIAILTLPGTKSKTFYFSEAAVARYKTKVCNTCGERKALSQFYAQAHLPGGKRHDCKKCSNLKVAEWVEANPQRRKEHVWSNRRKLRLAALHAYGNKCECCGEIRQEFLAIDHKLNNGSEERRKYGSSYMYQWLKDNAYPADFRILCHNCNCARGYYGYCPHELEHAAILAVEAKYPPVPELVAIN
jgi:hypothetical protein